MGSGPFVMAISVATQQGIKVRVANAADRQAFYNDIH
jgi:hypothetical protein